MTSILYHVANSSFFDTRHVPAAIEVFPIIKLMAQKFSSAKNSNYCPITCMDHSSRHSPSLARLSSPSYTAKVEDTYTFWTSICERGVQHRFLMPGGQIVNIIADPELDPTDLRIFMSKPSICTNRVQARPKDGNWA